MLGYTFKACGGAPAREQGGSRLREDAMNAAATAVRLRPRSEGGL